jgi:TBC1 domain family protein 5
LERDITQLRSTNKRLGESLEWILDVLQNESEAHDQERLHKRRDEALELLSYVKDVLIGKVTEIEESRLLHSKKEDTAVKQRFSVHPSKHILEPPSRQQSTGSRPLSPSQGPSIGSPVHVGSNLSAPMGRLPARSQNMQRTSVKDSVEQKKWGVIEDPLGVLRR